MNLVARSIGAEDYAVLADGDQVGRIRLASEHNSPSWAWHVQILVPMPAWCNGAAGSRDLAMTAFREAFIRLKTDIGPERYAQAIEAARIANSRHEPR